nr:hypothetical protein [Mycobacterium sp. E3298]
MSAPNRWAIKESGEVTFYDLVTGKAKTTLRTLKTSKLSTTGATTYSRGGRGNVKLVGFSSDREARLELTDAIFDNAAISMLTGNDLTTGVKNVNRNELVTVNSNSATLSKTPVGNLISVYKVNPDGTNGTELTKKAGSSVATGEYDISAKVLSFFSGDLPNGSKVRVYYVVATDNTAKNIKVTSDQFGKTFKVTIDVLVRDEYTKADYAGIYTIPNAKFEDNFDFDFSSDGDPAVLALNLEILKSPTSNDMWELTIYDDALIL